MSTLTRTEKNIAKGLAWIRSYSELGKTCTNSNHGKSEVNRVWIDEFAQFEANIERSRSINTPLHRQFADDECKRNRVLVNRLKQHGFKVVFFGCEET